MTLQLSSPVIDLSGWQARPLDELLRRQLAALDAWNLELTSAADAEPRECRSRELRLDAARRCEVRQRERDALHARADADADSDFLAMAAGEPRAVVAHRNGWFRDKVQERLVQYGVLVVASVDDGAEAAAAVIFDQPDLLLVEERLPFLSGGAVMARARRFSPDTVIGATAMDRSEMSRLFDHGARAVFTRRIAPDEVADGLLGCLSGCLETIELR